MSKPKELIPIQNLTALADSLAKLEAITRRTIEDCKEAEMPGIETEGWPTLAKGLQHIIDQMRKFVGPASRIHTMSCADVLLENHPVPQTRFPRRVPKAVQQKISDAHKQVAEVKKPYKKPPKDDPAP
jgi:hypothetical protein